SRREDLPVAANQELVQTSRLASSPLPTIYAVRLLESASDPEAQDASFLSSSRSGDLRSVIHHAGAGLSLVVPCSLGLVGISRHVWNGQCCGLFPDGSTLSVEISSHPSSSVCLLPCRLRLRIPAWNLGLHDSAAWAGSHIHRANPYRCR